MKKELEKSFKGNISILPNGIAMEKFRDLSKQSLRSKFGMSQNEKIILFVGGLKSIKGVRYLIEAFKTVSQTVPGARLLLIGEGQERHNLQALVKEKNLEEKVHFLGALPNEKVLEYMVASDIFALPSLFETFGIVNLEAMASGLPVVATRVYGVPEVVQDGVNGFLVEPKNSQQLAEKIVLLLSNDQLREKISLHNKETAKKYNWGDIVLRLEKIYLETINSKNHG